MKYQDLCIKISEVLRAKGVNTVYFEDVNLLNSEDVIYPAAVVQLVRVEQERDSDRYTIMLTIAEKQQDAKIECGTRWINIDKGLTWQDGGASGTGLLRFATLQQINELQVFGTPNVPSTYRFSFTTVNNAQHSCVAYFIQYWTPSVTPKKSEFYKRLFDNTSYTFTIQDYTRVCVDFEKNVDFEIKRNAISLEQKVTLARVNAPIMDTMRGITDILSDDERIQINSCVTTPFKWKFRDEVEGVTAEINLSLFFDSRCN